MVILPIGCFVIGCSSRASDEQQPVWNLVSWKGAVESKSSDVIVTVQSGRAVLRRDHDTRTPTADWCTLILSCSCSALALTTVLFLEMRCCVSSHDENQNSRNSYASCSSTDWPVCMFKFPTRRAPAPAGQYVHVQISYASCSSTG